MVIHQQTSDEIAHEGYRAACYSDPNVSDRLSLLLQPVDHIWLSVNLYRDSRHAISSRRKVRWWRGWRR